MFGRILSVVTALIVALSVVNLILMGNIESVIRYIWPLALLGYLVWISFWNPCVIVDESQVRLVNVFRTIAVPFTAIRRLDNRFALTLFTAGGRFVAWAAPASAHRSVARSKSAARADTASSAGTHAVAKRLSTSGYMRETLGAAAPPRAEPDDAATVIRKRIQSGTTAGPSRSDEQKPPESTVSIKLHVVQFVVLGALLVASALGVLL